MTANMMGLPLVPPFNDETTKGAKILKGVNYASGSAGILDDTGLSSVKPTTYRILFWFHECCARMEISYHM